MGGSDNYFRLTGDTQAKEQQHYKTKRNKRVDEKAELFCFICLEENLENCYLISCCSVCTACVHKRCWYSWRKTQKLSSLRSKILGLNKLDPLLCTICKTGTAKIEDEKDFNWIVNNNTNKEYLQDELLRTIASILNNEGNDSSIPILHFRYIFSINLLFLIITIVVIIIFTVVFHFTATYVLLIALFVLYEIIVLQIVLYLYVRIRYS
ncbi:conserved Plasmodium protein, unknown function [Plasmodium vivax]|uniref:Uncharacterized protein n=6 Tax=Plasmodium vivax TaxID=5855 RepID=A5K8Q6_PLAVS|nr:hypothetical protein, conserved [Plasmodium vivax]KMZ77487.1 hypothetical protein PVIIG_01457 [Plasmodium vivax India VII]KMZ84649.1 hypothetical protein PVBG_00429 [Plasmodium vivax Brazil I]KMZ89927.1 hypothetical protein PVMG_03488 [Plasmodium vivax Mauritania I]KMZ96647.1 hypothetical protein PVNG_05177 [Plasmodium vivax North Korean]EDL44202.1 hypothetical protein, conserved [Plasmodium vivax]|eukprot:XP_001613929.1 hypothetical protein [Plasmodium vivax Sal-1]